MAESVREQPHDETMATVTPEQQETEEEKVKQREALARELVATAGPVPASIQRLPCPVIIPQRRPRNKDRGFVRAYAPVLDDCGISQDVFLRFLEYLDAVNHVRLSHFPDTQRLVELKCMVGLSVDRRGFYRRPNCRLHPNPRSHDCWYDSFDSRRGCSRIAKAYSREYLSRNG